jgi:hypothetical protein
MGIRTLRNTRGSPTPSSTGTPLRPGARALLSIFLIGLWEQRGYRCEKPVIARNIHTGSYHIETYETSSAYFVCVSYQYLNLINRYSLLNHYLVEAGGKADRLHPITPTNEVAGQAIERALRSKWREIGQHLDTFLLSAARASAYQASEVYLKQHIATAVEEFYTSERYAHLRDATRLMAGPFYLPAEVMWTQYSDQTMHFSLAHELIHIVEGDIKKPGRVTTEKMGADMGAVSLLISIAVSTARRRGYRPTIANFTMGPIVFLPCRGYSLISTILRRNTGWENSVRHRRPKP